MDLTQISQVLTTKPVFNALSAWEMIFFAQNTNLQTFSRYPAPGPMFAIPGEASDPSVSADCGLAVALGPPQLIWTQCTVPMTPMHGSVFAPQTGVCIDTHTGEIFGTCNHWHEVFQDNFHTSMGDPFCGGIALHPHRACWLQSCCGDGILQEFETCDNSFADAPAFVGSCNATCGRPLMNVNNDFRRKRQAPPMELPFDDPRNIAYFDEFGQLDLTINITLPPQFNFSASNDSISTFVFGAADFVLGRLGISSNSMGLFTKVEEFVEKTDIGAYTDPANQGLLFWLQFLVSCPQPVALDCENGVPAQGLGTIATILELVPIFFWLFVIVGLTGMWLGGFPATVLYTFTAIFGAQIFTARAYHYPLYCFPLITECAPTAIVNLTEQFNATFPPFWDELIISSDAGSCTAEIFDCRSAGLNNGLDYFITILQVWFPDWSATFFNSFLFTFLDLIPILSTSLNRAHFPNGVPETVDKCLDFIGIFAIAQVFAIGALTYILGLLLFTIISNLLGRLGDTAIFGVAMVMAYEETSEIELMI